MHSCHSLNLSIRNYNNLQYVSSCFGHLQALEAIRKYDFSAAIFAAGWVYECHEDKTEFRKNQDK